jgi:serine/threonine-protein kinase
MEFLDGIDLEQLVTRFGPQPASRVVHILAQVAGSLGEAHAVGLVHRDVKPANIILCEQRGVYDTAKVVDFGLVKDLTRLGSALLTLSGSSSIVGTPLYLAPEAISAPDKIDARADLYALGAVGYFLLTGRPVFVGASLFEVAAQHLQQQPVPPSRMTDAPVPAALETLILECLAKDAAQRPASAEIVAERLAAAGVEPWLRRDAEAWWGEFGASARRRSPLPSESPGPKTVVIDLATRAR